MPNGFKTTTPSGAPDLSRRNANRAERVLPKGSAALRGFCVSGEKALQYICKALQRFAELHEALNVRIGHPGAGGHHSRFGGGDGAVEGDGHLMFRDGQQDVEGRFLGEERLQGQTDDAAQAALTRGQLVIGAESSTPSREASWVWEM